MSLKETRSTKLLCCTHEFVTEWLSLINRHHFASMQLLRTKYSGLDAEWTKCDWI